METKIVHFAIKNSNGVIVGVFSKCIFPPLTCDPSGCARDVRDEDFGLSRGHPSVVAGGPGLVGDVAMDNGLAVSDMTVGV